MSLGYEPAAAWNSTFHFTKYMSTSVKKKIVLTFHKLQVLHFIVAKLVQVL